MRRAWFGLLLAAAALGQDRPWAEERSHGWAMSVGTGFDAAPVLLDVRYTGSAGLGLYLGAGGRPDPHHSSWTFSLNFNDRGTLRRTDTAAYAGLAVSRSPRFAWGVGFGRHTSGWEIDHSGWFTAEEQARLDTTTVRQGAHGWFAYHPGRMLGFQVQAGPGWAGVSLAIKFY